MSELFHFERRNEFMDKARQRPRSLNQIRFGPVPQECPNHDRWLRATSSGEEPIISAIYRFLFRSRILMLVMRRPGSAIVSCTSRAAGIAVIARLSSARVESPIL